MIDLREEWGAVERRIRSASDVMVLTDFDGTLVPLAEHPVKVSLSAEGRSVLCSIAGQDRAWVGVVSGRALQDLIAKVGLSGIWYAGNHGYELQNPKGRSEQFYDSGEAKYLEAVARDMARAIAGIPGIYWELKGPVLALHYRQVDPESIPQLEAEFVEIVELHHERISLARGKCVLEAKIRGPFTKGTAVRKILKESPPGTFPIYFGDDTSDQAAFLEVRDRGLAVVVGEEASLLAQFSLPSPRSVIEVMRGLNAILESR